MIGNAGNAPSSTPAMSSPIARGPRAATPVTASSASATRAQPLKGKPALSPFRALLDRPISAPSLRSPAGRLAPEATSMRALGPIGRDRGSAKPEGEPRGAIEPARTSQSSVPEPLPLVPFRVDPALLPQAPPPSVPAMRHDELAFAAASELVESMRVGRFGREGHAVSLRLRLPTGVASVELREEGGVLRLRLEGASAELGERMRDELASRGLTLDALELA